MVTINEWYEGSGEGGQGNGEMSVWPNFIQSLLENIDRWSHKGGRKGALQSKTLYQRNLKEDRL